MPDSQMPAQLERLEHLEALIDDVVQGEAPISLAELINLIAQPSAFDRFCCRAA